MTLYFPCFPLCRCMAGAVGVLSLLTVQSAPALAHGEGGIPHQEQSYPLTGFTKIDLGGVYEARITVGQDFAISTSGHEKEVKGLIVEMKDGTLIIGHKDKVWTRKETNNKNRNSVRVEISLPALTAFTLGGVGEVKVTGIDADDFELSIGGVGETTLSGTCKTLSASVSGVGEVDAKDLKCEDGDVNLVGVGEVSVYTSKSIDANVAGVGQISVYGKPQSVKKSKSWLSEITIK